MVNARGLEWADKTSPVLYVRMQLKRSGLEDERLPTGGVMSRRDNVECCQCSLSHGLVSEYGMDAQIGYCSERNV